MIDNRPPVLDIDLVDGRGPRDLQGLDALDAHRIREAVDAARAPATRRTYRSLWSAFADWGAGRGIEVLPATPEAVAAFLAERAEAGASLSTIQITRAAIAAAHIDANLDDPCVHAGVRRTMRGLSRTLGTAARQAAPLSGEVAAVIRFTACRPRIGRGGREESQKVAEQRGLVDIAIVSVMRDALLRRSEAAALTWRDVELQPDGSGRLFIQRSKTDQMAEGRVLYLSPQTMADLNAIRGLRDVGPESRVFGLSAGTIGKRITKACEAAGLVGDYRGHSPRVGMAQDLAAHGAELPSLMEAGRWTSPTMPARYTRSQAAGRGAVANYYLRR